MWRLTLFISIVTTCISSSDLTTSYFTCCKSVTDSHCVYNVLQVGADSDHLSGDEVFAFEDEQTSLKLNQSYDPVFFWKMVGVCFHAGNIYVQDTGLH